MGGALFRPGSGCVEAPHAMGETAVLHHCPSSRYSPYDGLLSSTALLLWVGGAGDFASDNKPLLSIGVCLVDMTSIDAWTSSTFILVLLCCRGMQA